MLTLNAQFREVAFHRSAYEPTPFGPLLLPFPPKTPARYVSKHLVFNRLQPHVRNFDQPETPLTISGTLFLPTNQQLAKTATRRAQPPVL